MDDPQRIDASSPSKHKSRYTRDVRKELLISIWRLQISSKPKSAYSIFHRHFYCDSFTREENCIPNLPCTQRPFGNYWASAMFRGPDFIAKLSDGLNIIDPIFIT